MVFMWLCIFPAARPIYTYSTLFLSLPGYPHLGRWIVDLTHPTKAKESTAKILMASSGSLNTLRLPHALLLCMLQLISERCLLYLIDFFHEDHMNPAISAKWRGQALNKQE